MKSSGKRSYEIVFNIQEKVYVIKTYRLVSLTLISSLLKEYRCPRAHSDSNLLLLYYTQSQNTADASEDDHGDTLSKGQDDAAILLLVRIYAY